VPCIPSLGSKEYARLSNIRNEMWGALAKEFSDINKWIIGFEPNFYFQGCKDYILTLDSIATFFVDSMKGMKKVIKEENPDATVISNFLGQSGSPIYIDRKLVQPSVLLSAIIDRIAQVKESSSLYYDELMTAIYPDLLDDRFPDETTNLIA